MFLRSPIDQRKNYELTVVQTRSLNASRLDSVEKVFGMTSEPKMNGVKTVR